MNQPPHVPILAALAAIGASSGGCISTSERKRHGIDDSHAQALRDRAALTLVVPGVDLVGPAPATPIALANAAVLRGGPSARLDGRSGLEWRGILDARPTNITVSTRRGHLAMRQRVEVRIPLAGRLGLTTIEYVPRRRRQPAEHINGVPVAPVVDCLVMLAAAEEWRDLGAAWREADFRGLLNERVVEASLGRGVTGSRAIRELMQRHPILGDEHKFLGRAERHLLAGFTRRGLKPLVNKPLPVRGQITWPDFYLPDARLAVEGDGGGHDRPARQLADNARAELLASIGIATLRFSDVEIWRDVDACVDEVELVIAERMRRTA